MVQEALHVLGDASAVDLAAFVLHKYGERIEAKFLPLFRASLLDRERREAARRAPPPPLQAPVLSGSSRIPQIERLACDLMTAHHLSGWSFGFNRRMCALGMCFYDRRTIELSIHFVERNDLDEVRDTILHEIAHALVGPGHGHDRVWKRKCVEIGARPLRCGEADMPAGRWRAQCGRCGKHFHRYRKPRELRGWFCLGCGPEQGRLSWKAA